MGVGLKAVAEKHDLGHIRSRIVKSPAAHIRRRNDLLARRFAVLVPHFHKVQAHAVIVAAHVRPDFTNPTPGGGIGAGEILVNQNVR